MATSTQKRYERALYGPSILEVTLGAVLSILLGAGVAMGYLILKPVETVRELPDEQTAFSVYYLEGSNNGSKGRQYLRKRQLFLEGSSSETIQLSEDELNTWMASSRAKPDATAEGALLTPQAINFRVRDGVFQVGVPSTLNLFGVARPLIVQARGDFEKSGDRFVFDPHEMYLGSLAAHHIPGLPSLLTSRLMTSQGLPEEMVNAWARLDQVVVEGNHLVLSLP